MSKVRSAASTTYLGGQSTAWRDANAFADGELVPCDTGDCAGSHVIVDSAVAPSSWGRIKTAVRR